MGCNTVESITMTKRPSITEIAIVLRTILSAGVAAGATWIVDGCGMIRSRMLIFIAAVCIIDAEVGAEDGVDVTFEGRFGGIVHACAVSGSNACIGQGQDFVVDMTGWGWAPATGSKNDCVWGHEI